VRPPPGRGRSSPGARHSSQAAEGEFAVAATVDVAPPGAESILSRESLCVAALAQGEEPESASGEAGSRGRLGR
jgi:hypothetical protein